MGWLVPRANLRAQHHDAVLHGIGSRRGWATFGQRRKYVLFDLPGQMELSTNQESVSWSSLSFALRVFFIGVWVWFG